MRMSRRMGLKKPVYTWDVYNLSTTYTSGYTDTNVSYDIPADSTWYCGTGLSFNSANGTYTISGIFLTISTSTSIDQIKNKYCGYGLSETNMVIYPTSGSTKASSIYVSGGRIYTPTVSYSQGGSTGTTVTSTDSSAYPVNGQQGTYWYVRR